MGKLTQGLEAGAPSSPAAGFSVLYPLTADAKWYYKTAAGAVKTLATLDDVSYNHCQFRLTLTSGTPVTTTNVTAAETLYWTPYKGNKISLYDGTVWNTRTSAEISVDVPDATNCYDVFVYDNSGTPTLELTAWTNETTRATALTLQDGILSKTGALTRRYLGTFYSTTAGNGQIEDSLTKRNLWNYYNRVVRPMLRVESTSSWTYTTATFRQANASTANQLEYVQGVSEDAVKADVLASFSSDQAAGNVVGGTGIGVDSTSTNSASLTQLTTNQAAGSPLNTTAKYLGFPGVGRHTLVWLEYSSATGTTTWRGTNNIGVMGISGELMG